MVEIEAVKRSAFTKLWPDARTALDGIVKDGMLLAIGGFGLCGVPDALILALRETGVRNLTIASNAASYACAGTCGSNFDSGCVDQFVNHHR